MDYEITNEISLAGQLDDFDPLTGTFANSNGGSETMYRTLLSKLPPEYTDKFHFISSRVRVLHPTKKNILILNDTWDDPESQHLKSPESRARFRHLAFVSQYQFQTFHLAHGVSYMESSIMRNAIEPIPSHVKPDPTNGIRLIYHTTPHRGLELLVPTFLALLPHHPNLHLDVYSSFSLYGWKHRDAPYEQLFEQCRNHPNITYHGAVPNQVIREALTRAHIFAYPSIWPESSCIAAIEAMSAGCALVAPDYAALPETIGPYGYLYRWSENINEHVNRFAGLLNSVITAWQQPFIQENLKAQKAYTDNHYNWPLRIQEWKNLLDRLG